MLSVLPALRIPHTQRVGWALRTRCLARYAAVSLLLYALMLCAVALNPLLQRASPSVTVCSASGSTMQIEIDVGDSGDDRASQAVSCPACLVAHTALPVLLQPQPEPLLTAAVLVVVYSWVVVLFRCWRQSARAPPAALA